MRAVASRPLGRRDGTLPAGEHACDGIPGGGDHALAVAGVVAYPVNRWLIARGRGHAVLHRYDHDGGLPTSLVAGIAAAMGVFGGRRPRVPRHGLRLRDRSNAALDR